MHNTVLSISIIEFLLIVALCMDFPHDFAGKACLVVYFSVWSPTKVIFDVLEL